MTDTKKESPQYPAKEGLTMPGDPAVVVTDRGHPSGESTREETAPTPTQVGQSSNATGDDNDSDDKTQKSKWPRITWRHRKSNITMGMNVAEKEKFWNKLKSDVESGAFELKRLEAEPFDYFEKLIIHEELLRHGHIQQEVFDQFIKTEKMTSGACIGMTSEESKAFWDNLWERVVDGTFHLDLFKNFTKTQRKSFERKVRLKGYTLPHWGEEGSQKRGEKRKVSEDVAGEPANKKPKAEGNENTDQGPFHVIFCHDKRKPLLTKHYDHVKQTLTDLKASEDEALKPTIENYKTITSQFVVVCADKESMLWVLKQKIPPVETEKIHSYRRRFLDASKVKIGIRIPVDINRPSHVVIKRLGLQNPQLKTNTWNLIRTPTPKLISAFIPMEAVDELEKLSWRPYFELGRIVAYIIRTKTTPHTEQLLKRYNNEKNVLSISKDFIPFLEYVNGPPEEPPMMPGPFPEPYNESMEMDLPSDIRVIVWNRNASNGGSGGLREPLNPWAQPERPMNIRDRLGPHPELLVPHQSNKRTLSSRFGESAPRFDSPPREMMQRPFPGEVWDDRDMGRSAQNLPPPLMQDLQPRNPQMYGRVGRPPPWMGNR